ncbi:MAG: M3 family metallopeptidase [Candidatus Thorarchaeota archaeon]
MNSAVRSLDDLGAEFEKYVAQLFEQRYNQTAGLPYDKKLMTSLSETIVGLSSEFLNSYEEPRSFYLNSIYRIAEARKLHLSNEIYEKRMALISTKKFRIHEKAVNWGSWRQFNADSSISKDRQSVFDEFVNRIPELAPLIMKRFKISSQVYSLYDSSPLEAFLEREFLSYEKLYDLILALGDGARKPFLQAADHYAPEILEKENFEYFDDFYLARARIYSSLNTHFTKKNPISVVKGFLSHWGFENDLSQIKVDSENREKKSPSAFCFSIQVPNDVRVVYKRVSPFSDFTSVFHEFGHAVHATSGNPKDPYWKRYVIPMSVAETFSVFLEMMLQYPPFLQQELGLSEEVVREIIDRRHFINLYFLVFYSANSLMKLEFWKRGYTLESASTRYQELTRRFFWEIPGDYWMLHHIMPDYDLYSPAYLLASIRVKEWTKQMIDEYGEEFWKEKQSGAVFRDLAATRGEFDLTVWDMDPKPYLEDQSSFSF